MRKLLGLLVLSIVLQSCGGEKKETTTSQQEVSPLEQLNESIRENPDKVELYLKRSDLHREAGRFSQALADVNRCIAIDSLTSNFHVVKGETLFALEQFEEAVISFEKAIEIDKANPDPLVRLAQMKLYLRQYESSIDLANQALRIDKYQHLPYYIKGWVFLETGDTVKAVGSFRTSIEVNSEYYDGYMMLGKLYSDAGKDIALEYFTSASELDTNNAEPLYHKGFYHQRMGEFDAAFAMYKKCVQKSPTHAFALYNQGYMWMEIMDDPDSAFVYFAKAAYVEPQYKEAFFNMGLCRELKGEKEVALKYYQRALGIDPDFEKAIMGYNRITGE